MRLIKQLVSEGITLTKRELFYLNKDFKSQRVLDDIIEVIACILECTRQSLNIVASTGGCIIENLIFHCGEEEVDCNCVEKQISSKKVKISNLMHHLYF
jgi:meiotic recombination protein SPO11